MVAATFRHLASRNLDPQLHTHCVVANMTRNGAGEWRSIEATAIRRNRKLIGAHYRGELARRLEALGYETVPTMIGPVPGFELADYDREMREAFSTRRRDILEDIKRRGRALQRGAGAAGGLVYAAAQGGAGHAGAASDMAAPGARGRPAVARGGGKGQTGAEGPAAGGGAPRPAGA